jgi:photosystem II stability/assembly factor-like uncharacterized protein
VALHFVDENEGWITGGPGPGSSYLVLHTTDGGQNWVDQSFGNDCVTCEDIYFVDSQTGWICGGFDDGTTKNRHIHKTTDGGQTWSSQTVPQGYKVSSVDSIMFANQNIGWASTSSYYDNPAGDVLYTTDGGATWTVQFNTGLDYNYGIFCENDQRVAVTSWQAASPQGQKVFYSTDGGGSWNSTIPHELSSNAIYMNGNTIRVTGRYSTISVTHDLGATWSKEFVSSPWDEIEWSDALHGWVVSGYDCEEDAHNMRTSDGGITWTHDPDVPGGTGVQFVDPSNGWMLWNGSPASIWRTTDAGSTWTKHSIPSGSWIEGMFFANATVGWAHGGNGTIKVTGDGGQTWSSQASGTSQYIECMEFIDENVGWAAGGWGSGNGFVIHTTDGGSNWVTQMSGVADNHFQSIFFLDAQNGWLGSMKGHVWKTTDGGSNWNQVAKPAGVERIASIMMEDLNIGWLAEHDSWDWKGAIYNTTDGGLTWTVSWEASWEDSFMGALTMDFNGDPWACGAHNTLLRYGTLRLEADNDKISESTGGIVQFTLDAGVTNAYRNYLLLGSASGTEPGTPLPGGMATLPVNWDAFTVLVINLLNTPIFYDFMGSLDAAGMAAAKFDTLGPLPSGTAGLTFNFAYALHKPWNFVSNPVPIEIVP